MWTWIWIGLIIGALAWWAYVGWNFYQTTRSTVREVQRAAAIFEPMSQTQPVVLDPVEPQLLDTEALAEQLHGLRLRKADRRARREARRRAAQSRWLNHPAGRAPDQL